ncbi:cyclase family protein [Egbenema bharatensis]|uniref:cyclase family protein n=1 Tax=Egbenema bharatensis TaxID=3463334 RepID=UPI003A8A32CD
MKWQIWLPLMLVGVMVILLTAQVRPARTQPTPPLSEWQVIDLTQPLTATMPIWPGDPEVEIQPWANYAEAGYFIHRITIGEHSGTHWGTPNTFITGATSAEQVPIEKLVAPAIVMDIRDQAAQDEDYRLSMGDVQAWEASNGQISPGSVVILLTGWQERWTNPTAFINQDEQGVMHWPGFSAEAVEFLVSERQIAGLGTDTHGADPGNDEVYGASSAIYAADGLILECLGGLDRLPVVGATVVVGGLPIQGGSGSPARVMAFLPA